MSELVARPLAGAMEDTAAGDADWMCAGRLPYGATILTGIAGKACPRPALEGMAMEVYAEYAARGCVGGEPAGADGGALYVHLGADERRVARQLSRRFPDGPPPATSIAAWDGRLGSSLAEALDAELARSGCSLAVVEGASVGTEARQRLTAAIAGLSRVGRKRRCAVVLTMPLGPKNWLKVKDPATGLSAAADSVWEVFSSPSGGTCFCTAPGTAASFPIGAPAAPARPAPPREGGGESVDSQGVSRNEGDSPVA